MVLDPEAFEHFDVAVVETHRQGDGHAALGVFGPFANRMGKFDDIGCQIELVAGHTKNFGIVMSGDHGKNEVANKA
jgi:hypothetical protein